MATTLIANVPLVVASVRYEKGDKFINSNDAEAAAQVAAGFAHAPSGAVEGAGLTGTSDGDADEQVQLTGSRDGDAPLWNKKISPDDYLKQYPNGPAANLAREVLAERAVGNTDVNF